MGYALVQLGRYRDAIRACNRAIRIYPHFMAAWVTKGIALCGLMEYYAALDCFEYAGEEASGSTRALYWRGLALSRTGQFREAIDCLTSVVDRDARYADAWVILSNCHFMLGNLDESGRCFMTAYGIDKQDIRDLVRKSITNWRQGNSREALQHMSGVFGILLR
jgi:tetratricopeptide (TPR) repeat protein